MESCSDKRLGIGQHVARVEPLVDHLGRIVFKAHGKTARTLNITAENLNGNDLTRRDVERGYGLVAIGIIQVQGEGKAAAGLRG